jgi:site-specific DNA-methyltransferase (adenine-specific)
MAEMDEGSVDAVVCDPPYGLEFMGKEWDSFGGDVRQRDDATFTKGDRRHGLVRHGIGGSYGGDNQAKMVAFAAWCETWAREALRVLKPGGHLLAFGGTRTYHRLTCGIEDAGFEIRDSIAWNGAPLPTVLQWVYGSGFPKSLDVSKAIDKAAGAEREVVGATARGAQTESTGRYGAWGEGITPTAPATDAAREWQGWGTALKPGWEPCVVARKPLAGTVAENVQQHGTGALNIDGCRIGFASDADEREAKDKNAHAQFGSGKVVGYHGWQSRAGGGDYNPPGRWPANVVLDEQAAAMLDAQSGKRGGGFGVRGASSRIYGGGNGFTDATGEAVGYGDTGGASRFFYTAKASRSDRSTNGANNTHPTVKPTDLMRWLVRLVTPPGGVVLDPFAGSGSTLVAARAEGVRCIGIEREDEYAEIIAQRLSQLSLFSEGAA